MIIRPFQIKVLMIKTYFPSQSIVFYYATSLALSNVFLSPFCLHPNNQSLTSSFANYEQNHRVFLNLLTIYLAKLTIKKEGNNCTTILPYS